MGFPYVDVLLVKISSQYLNPLVKILGGERDLAEILPRQLESG